MTYRQKRNDLYATFYVQIGISTAKPEKKIDLQEVNKELVEIEKKATKSSKKHNDFLKELGLEGI